MAGFSSANDSIGAAPNCAIRVVSGPSVEAIGALIRGRHWGSELAGRAGDSTGRTDRGVLVLL